MNSKLLASVFFLCMIGCKHKGRYTHNGKEYDEAYSKWDTTVDVFSRIWVRGKDTVVEYDQMMPPPEEMAEQVNKRVYERNRRKYSKDSN